MSFIMLHQENGFCGHEPCMINVKQIASVMPVVGGNKWYVQSSNTAIKLTDGNELKVKERMDEVMGMLRSASGGEQIVGAGPKLVGKEFYQKG